MIPTSISIANFKAFGFPQQEIPLKPITLIFGPNSAGKSSAIHSLLWLNDLIVQGNADVRFPKLAQGKVDLGGFHQTIHRHENGRRIICAISFPRSALSSKVSGFFRIEKSVSLDLTFGQDIGSKTVRLLDYRLDIDGTTFLSAIGKGNHGFIVSSLDVFHEAVIDRVEQMSSVSECAPDSRPLSMAEIASLDAAGREELLIKNVSEMQQNHEDASRLAAAGLIIEFEGILPVKVHNESKKVDDDFWDDILPCRVSDLVGNLHALVNRAMTGLKYIPPLRDLPPRHIDLGESDTVWQGLFEDPELREKINRWLKGDWFKTKYEIEIAEFISSTALKREFPPLIQKEIAGVCLSRPEGSESYAEELNTVIEELHAKYADTDIEQFLRANPDLLERVISRESDVFYDSGDDSYLLPDDVTIYDLTDAEVREHIDQNLNWEPSVGIDALGDGDADAIELFQRWAKDQPLLLELFDRHGDPSAAITKFLEEAQFETRDVRRDMILRHVTHKTPVSLQDVGVGVSQVLPVVLHAFHGRNQIIAIEQPEIHIHPALQAELADIFIESALGENKNTFLLETHSEHLILRLLRRIRETTEEDTEDWPDTLRAACPNGLRPSDIAVLYVEPGDGEEGAAIKTLRVNELGEIIDEWPNGFFEERIKEVF